MIAHGLSGATSLSSVSGTAACHPVRAPLPSNLCLHKWRKGIVAAAGPGPAGPQPLTKPPLSSPPRPPGSPPGQLPLNGNGANGNRTNGPPGPAQLNGPQRPGAMPLTTPRGPGSLSSPPPPGSRGPGQVPTSQPPPPRPAGPLPGGPMGPPPAPLQPAARPGTPAPTAQPARPPSAPPPTTPPPGAAGARPGGQPAAMPLSRPGAPAGAPPPAALSRPAGVAPPPMGLSRPGAPSAPPALSRPNTAPSAPAQAPAAQPSTAAAVPPGAAATAAAAAAAAPAYRPPAPPSPPPVANPFANIQRAPSAVPQTPPPAAVGPAPPQRPAMPAPPAPPAAGPSVPPLNRPPPRPMATPPRPLGPVQQRAGGAAAAGPAGAALQPPPTQPLQQPLRPGSLLARQPPSAPPTTVAADVPVRELHRPNPPSLRVLEPLMAEAEAAAAASRQRLEIQEVVEDDDDSMFDDEDNEFMSKGSGLRAKGGKRNKRKEKVTAEMKREARKQREATRNEKAASRRRDKEEIFEVGDEGMSLDALADLLQVAESDIVRTLFMRGITMSVSQMLDKNTVKVVAADYDVVVVDSAPTNVTDAAKKRTEFISEEDVDDLTARPPVVTVMGHVDHGKTSLLDYIRKARVAAGEAGGITQAIGAYNTEVEVEGDTKTICFLDTPGHEAFSAMRARGAQVTDIAVIIVAADDGVRPQTREAVAHAQAAGVPIVVAINKIDKPGADVDRVKQELLELNLVPEEWGGNTVMVPVSAKKGNGVPDLLTQLLWVAEEKQLVSNAKRPARGTVIEAYLDRKKGPVATLLVQVGTLRPGDTVRAGASYGKVRSLSNDLGRTMPSAGPSIAVQLTGLNSVPAAGEEFEVYPTETAARLAAAEFEEKIKLRRIMEMSGGGSMVTLASLATVDEDQEAMQRLNIIIKADTSGMVEAIKSALSMLPQQSVMLRFLLAGAGDISSSDIDLAAASGGMIVAFNVEPDEAVVAQAKGLGVSIKSYRIIYELIEDVKAAMEGKLKLVEEKVPQGTAVVKALFGTGKKRVAGVAVTEGKMSKSGYVTVKRGKTVVYDGKLSSLRRVKDNVEEVSAGLECGLGCDGFTDWSEGDTLECYLLVTKSRRLEEARATTALDPTALA